MIPLRTALALARAETRRARGTLLFCVLSIALGVLAITAIRSLSLGVRHSIAAQAQRLFGGDLSLEAGRPLDDGVGLELTRLLEATGARSTASIRFYSMLARVAAAPGVRATQLVRIRAIGDGFPLYGDILTKPPAQFERLAQQPSVLLDPSVARALGLAPGDRVRVGELEASVLGTFEKTPGTPAAEFSMAPYVFMHERYLADTRLLATGSRIRYGRLFALPDGVSATEFKDAHWSEAMDARVTIRTSREAASNVRRFMSRLSGFMTVVGLITLFLGALGIGSAMHAFMASKLDHAAVLRCVGATSRDLFLVYTCLALGVALVGSALGAAVGTILPWSLGSVSEQLGAGLLPADLRFEPSASAVLHGMSAGVLSTLAFTLVPIWRTSTVAPLRVLGRSHPPPLGARRWMAAVGLGAALLSVFVLALAETESLRAGGAFTLALAAALAALYVMGRLVAGLARVSGARLSSFHVRQGVANLHRPGNQTGAVIVAVGMGFLLLGTLLIVQRSLERLLSFERREDLPNLFVIDVQPEQRADVERALRAGAAEGVELSPMISARIAAIDGAPVDVRHVERDDARRTWEDRMRTREYFLSYRAQAVPSETVTAGHFWEGRPREQEASIDEGLARNLGIELGDVLTLNIQGLPLDAKVTSFREIRWQALRPNAMILLSPGEIEDAPKMFVASARVAGDEARAALEQRLLAAHPNLTIVDAAEAAQTVLMILSRIATVFRGLGVLAVVTGAIIVGGAIAAGRFARQKEAMLFKVLGASRADLRRILCAEYASLALLGTASGWLLAEGLGRTVIPAVFDAAAEVPYVALSALALGIIALNVTIGLSVGRRVSGHTPLSILRQE